MKRSFNRDDAFSLEIVDPASKEKDPLQFFIEAGGSLFAFSGKSTFELLTADTIDPRNTEPETRHSYQKIFAVGVENSFVARTIIQAKLLLDSLVLRTGLDKEQILDHVWDCTKLLIACEASYYYIFTETTRLITECDEVIERGKRGNHIPPLPQVNDLYQHGSSFLGNAKRFLEKSHELLCIFYGAPNAGANFRTYREWMLSNANDKNEINDLLEQDKDWIRLISWCRNALDINHSKNDFKLEIENFKMHPGNKFSPPCWRYDFTGEKGDIQEGYSDIIHDMNVHMSNMLTFFEELFLLCLKDNWNISFNFGLFKKNAEDIDPKCPTLYFASINSDSVIIGKPENS